MLTAEHTRQFEGHERHWLLTVEGIKAATVLRGQAVKH